MESDLQKYLSTLKVLCSESNNEKRQRIADEFLEDITSDKFIDILHQIFSPANKTLIDSGI